MPLFDRAALQPGVARREVFGWAMYDFANSGYTTVVLTAVFAAYFVGGIAGGAAWATLAWTSALSLSYALVMLTMPGIGAYADRHAAKKKLLGWSTAACVLATALLALTPSVQGTAGVALAMALIVLSNTFYSYGESLCAAFLPELARHESLGKVSGWGWSWGYIGGMLALGLCLGYVLWAQSRGLPASHFVPVTMLITAVLYGAAACLTFALLKERAVARPDSAADGAGAPGGGWRPSLARLRQRVRAVRGHPDFCWLLACTVAYQGGVAVAITLAAIYAEQVIGFVPHETMLLIFALNLAAAAGAFLCGYGQDRLGHRRMLALTLLGWIVTCLLAAWATTKGQFWWAAAIAGLCMGSSQSAGRAMVGLLAPEPRLAEFFGLWTLATRLASIIGPLSYGLITWAANGNQRVAILATAVLFVAGLALLWPIDLARGQRSREPGRGALAP
ncbi:MAG: MFS transporter [Comamonas sp.]